ncbi:SDR family NAD(P)-dependent oxidoreductase [Subtercola sp. PAMC28395]|uniref:SDR family oxidoreductase n=1 Tax=Subtercola sp. PAMC28395 TaxID=2846775 RepID=UPI001C0AB94A|nr:SDR family NAD(P)-dependent oxidoreductase [Subtercola sp. PAMC28395]QWT23609.1 SDR family NAD(P)-dependent oxidoreductase [Subtercola sp. PAMC28395]
MSQQNRRAVVTGASSGIGAATVRRLRAHGWPVVAVARREDRLRALAEETGATYFVADLTVQADVDALAVHLAETGGVSTLVNNAGGAVGLDTVEHGSIQDWQWMFEINVVAVKRVITALLPLLRASVAGVPTGEGVADILTVSSIAGHIAYEKGGGYNAAKFAVAAMIDVLRLELSGEPIRVLEIAPGMVHTDEFSLVRFKGDQAAADAVYAGVPNPLTAEDVAETIVTMVELAPHISLDLVVIKPVAQSAAYKVHRGPLEVKQ